MDSGMFRKKKVTVSTIPSNELEGTGEEVAIPIKKRTIKAKAVKLSFNEEEGDSVSLFNFESVLSLTLA